MGCKRRPQPLNVVLLPPPLRNVVVEPHEEEGIEAHCSVQRGVGGRVAERVDLPADGGHEAQLLVQEGVPGPKVRAREGQGEAACCSIYPSVIWSIMSA